ncbi:MAG: hypothetical protein GY772_01845 [bacterium]|nr:hypothetical protein [bacterium]
MPLSPGVSAQIGAGAVEPTSLHPVPTSEGASAQIGTGAVGPTFSPVHPVPSCTSEAASPDMLLQALWCICTHSAEVQAKIVAEGVLPFGDEEMRLFRQLVQGPRPSAKKIDSALHQLEQKLGARIQTSGEDLNRALKNFERRERRRSDEGLEEEEESAGGFDPETETTHLASSGMALEEATELGSAAAAANKGRVAEVDEDVFAAVVPNFRAEMLEGLAAEDVAACQRVLAHFGSAGVSTQKREAQASANASAEQPAKSLKKKQAAEPAPGASAQTEAEELPKGWNLRLANILAKKTAWPEGATMTRQEKIKEAHKQIASMNVSSLRSTALALFAEDDERKLASATRGSAAAGSASAAAGSAGCAKCRYSSAGCSKCR